jgi:hypothetical protein
MVRYKDGLNQLRRSIHAKKDFVVAKACECYVHHFRIHVEIYIGVKKSYGPAAERASLPFGSTILTAARS